MKKFEKLGKMLSKGEQKKIMGGTLDAGQCGTNCDKTCQVTCNGTKVDGTCGFGQSGKCYCSGGC